MAKRKGGMAKRSAAMASGSRMGHLTHLLNLRISKSEPRAQASGANDQRLGGMAKRSAAMASGSRMGHLTHLLNLRINEWNTTGFRPHLNAQ